ncbi:tail assembly chaperone [Serratia phage vB_SlqS_ZDD2]|nr:tail assembly chaperone [Serratia phage vB_SlqS_ZDD2]
MAAFTLSLTPNRTFNSDVEICFAGGQKGKMGATFIYRTLDELKEQAESNPVKPDATKEEADANMIAFVRFIMQDWKLKETTAKFTDENIVLLMSNYPMLLEAITETYYRELLGARAKNSKR